jgi:pyrroline-5-carboxylate reductase
MMADDEGTTTDETPAGVPGLHVAVLGGGVMGETLVSAVLQAGWSADDA